VDIEVDMQIIGIRRWRSNVKKDQNGRESLRRLKPTVGCNTSKRRKERNVMSWELRQMSPVAQHG
jgi:hypothetical protein